MALRILHFVTGLEEGTAFHRYIDTLLQNMGQRAEVHLCVLSLPPSALATSYPTFSLFDSESRSFLKKASQQFDLQRKYLQHLYDIKPDIVHIHGSWNYQASRIARWTRKRGFFVVLSPYDSLQVAEEHSDYGMKMWKMLTYQKSMLRRASAVHVTDKMSYDSILEGKINERTVYFEGFNPEEDESYESLSNDMLLLYRKLLDSHAFERMDVSSHEALCALLHLGLESDMQQQSLTPDAILNLRRLTPAAWRYISLLAHDHGLDEIIRRGTLRMQLRLPEIRPEDIDRFPSTVHRDTEPLPSDVLLSANRKMRKTLNNILDREASAERKFCVMLLNIKYHYEHSTLSMRHLCDLYDILVHEDINDDVLKEVLELLNLHNLARRICQILWETASLQEGFMPVYRLDDDKTEEIRKFLIKY